VKKRSGGSYSLSELIFSVVIVSLGALALGFSILEVERSQLASKTIFSVVSLDAELAHQLSDIHNYQDPSTKRALRSARLPASLIFNLKLKLPSGVFAIAIRPNETLTLDRSFQKCAGYPIGDCRYKLKVTLEQHPPAFSYEVSSAFPEAALSLERFGRNKVIIPRSAYRDPTQVACDPRQDIGLSGLASSDRYDCISRPSQTCARGTLPKSLLINPETHSLEFECGKPSKVVRCPANYSLNRVDTRTLDDDGGSKKAVCVRTTAAVAYPVRQTAPAIRLAGRACPADYKSDSTCTMVNVKRQIGHCGTGVAQPVAGKLRFSQNKQLGMVDCGVDLQNQVCGAIWEGEAQLKIKCVLDEPEFADALK
jgi:hypothetical protein